MGSLKLLLPIVPILAIMAVLLVSGCVAPSDVTGGTVGAPCSSDSNCSDGETCIDGTCQAAPTGPVCGDGACDADENKVNCPLDCPTYRYSEDGQTARSRDRTIHISGSRLVISDRGIAKPAIWSLSWSGEQVFVDSHGNIYVLSDDKEAIFMLGNPDSLPNTVQDPQGQVYGVKEIGYRRTGR